jgi:hypothetical protein
MIFGVNSERSTCEIERLELKLEELDAIRAARTAPGSHLLGKKQTGK